VALVLRLAGAADALIAFGVVLTGLVIRSTGWLWLDPVVSIAIGVLIAVTTWRLLADSVNLAMDAVPRNIDPYAVHQYLAALPEVTAVHDLHIWAMSTTEAALTAHIVMPANACGPRFLGEVCKELHDRFDIDHATLQVDSLEAPDPCRLAPAGTI